ARSRRGPAGAGSRHRLSRATREHRSAGASVCDGAAVARRFRCHPARRRLSRATREPRSAVASVCDAGAVARRFVLRLDLDEFIAAVERLRRPELEGKPIVVGGDGDPSKRGVVSTASYEARAFGIRSAMPLRTAYKRYPDAIFLPVDSRAYLVASSEVMDTLRTFDDEVEG